MIVSIYESVFKLSWLTPTCWGSQVRDLEGRFAVPQRVGFAVGHKFYIDALANRYTEDRGVLWPKKFWKPEIKLKSLTKVTVFFCAEKIVGLSFIQNQKYWFNSAKADFFFVKDDKPYTYNFLWVSPVFLIFSTILIWNLTNWPKQKCRDGY